MTVARSKARALLIMDGWEDSSRLLTDCLNQRGYSVERVNRAETALEKLNNLAASRPSMVFMAERLPDTSGLKLLEQLQGLSAEIPMVVVLASLQARTVVRAMSLGAFDCLTKPIEREDLEEIIDRAFNLVRDSQPDHSADDAQEIVRQCFFESSDAKLRRIIDIAGRVAASKVPVVVSGESGVGKEVIARYIHAKSPRADQPLIKINCAAFPTDLLESELFGYERGAFTGALDKKPGKFELADKGSIFLDEIGEFSLPLQPKLLHVLQDQEFMRLGGTRPIRVNTRIIAATNRRLETAVSLGEFREDLYYRLNVVHIEIPPLRERIHDVPALCAYFLHRHRPAGADRVPVLPKRLLDTFLRYEWPGNVRQLENSVKQYIVLQDEALVIESLMAVSHNAGPPPDSSGDQEPDSLKSVGAKAADEAELRLVRRTLEQKHWNRKQVARELHISYKALLNKLHRWEAEGRLKAS